ncbi:DNA repair protein RecO [Liquorilactobacillus satsumensis]|uniref:DNA repair protein RecO n=1 Tax=Liquorilactobacillus satsumensis TaxID=259059 RepID=UPI0036F25303
MGTTRMAEFEGIVMFRRDYRERDMLVKILTDHYGVKMFFVRGARKRGFKLGAAILPFTTASYTGTINDDGLSFIDAVKDVAQYQQICQDILLNAYATYILGLVAAAFGDARPLGIWYPRIVAALAAIDHGLDAGIVTNIVELQLLENFGVKPNLKGCVICGRQSGTFDFSESYGGLLCQQHWSVDRNRMHLDQRTVYFMRFLARVDLLRLRSINLKEETKVKLRDTLDQIYNNDVGVSLKPKHFLDEMLKQNQNILKLRPGIDK